MHFPSTFLFVASLVLPGLGHDIVGKVEWNELCTDISTLGRAKVVLNDGFHKGSVRSSGDFVIPDASPGSYVLSVISHDFVFDKLRVDISPSNDTPTVYPYIPATPHDPPSPIKLPYPFKLQARVKHSYFVAREGFNLLGMFQNPMMMLMGLTGVMVIAMPYLMKNMDPDLAQDVKERQASLARMQSGDFSGGLSALLGGGDSASQQAPAPAKVSEKAASSARNTKGGGKARRR